MFIILLSLYSVLSNSALEGPSGLSGLQRNVVEVGAGEGGEAAARRPSKDTDTARPKGGPKGVYKSEAARDGAKGE